MSEMLKSMFEKELERNGDTASDVSRFYYKRFHPSLMEHDDEWTKIEVEDLKSIDEDREDKAVAYTPTRVYTATAAYGGVADLEFVSAPRHYQELEEEI